MAKKANAIQSGIRINKTINEILFITLDMATNQQTIFNRLLIYAYIYYLSIIIILIELFIIGTLTKNKVIITRWLSYCSGTIENYPGEGLTGVL